MKRIHTWGRRMTFAVEFSDSGVVLAVLWPDGSRTVEVYDTGWFVLEVF